MRFFNKYFFIGVGTGVLLTILVIIAGGYLFIWWYSSGKMSENTKILEGSLRPPAIPSEGLADYNWTVKSLDGRDFRLADTKGKVVFINFWATWCAPCVAEMPSIQRLYDKVKDDGVIFVCVSREDTSKVSRFVKERSFTFPIYTMKDNPPTVFSTQGIPATFILSPDGKIAFKHIGSAKWDDEKSINFIKRLIQ